MLQLWIRYTAILLCSDYLYQRLLAIKGAPKFQKEMLFLCGFPFFLSLASLPESIQCISYALLLLFHFLYYGFTSKTHSDTIFTTLLLSYALCFCVFILSGFLCSKLLGLISYYLYGRIVLYGTITQLTIGIVMSLICPLPFRIKRLKNGMPFLKNQHLTTLGSLFGLSVIFCTILVSSLSFKSTIHEQWATLLFFFIFMFAILLFIWWRNQLSRTYIDQLRIRDIKLLEDELQDCQNTITSLKQENQQLAKLIHRDNKQVASLELAVETFLSSPTDNSAHHKKLGNDLLLELQNENHRRKQMLTDLSKTEQLSSTNIISVDCLLNYMLHKCQTLGITLDFSLNGDIHFFLAQIIKEQDFITLVADLLENALIATTYGKGTHILLDIGVSNDFYFISVSDSGIPFTKETLLHLGKKQYTTHKDNGGSGIGLISTYELLQKYQGSLHIEEYLNSKTPFCKKISLLFDGKEEYHLLTNRDVTELAYLSQRTDLLITALV